MATKPAAPVVTKVVTEDHKPVAAVETDPEPQRPEASLGDNDHPRWVREDMAYKQKMSEWQERHRFRKMHPEQVKSNG